MQSISFFNYLLPGTSKFKIRKCHLFHHKCLVILSCVKSLLHWHVIGLYEIKQFIFNYSYKISHNAYTVFHWKLQSEMYPEMYGGREHISFVFSLDLDNCLLDHNWALTLCSTSGQSLQWVCWLTKMPSYSPFTTLTDNYSELLG